MDTLLRERAGRLLSQRWRELGRDQLLQEEQDYLLLWEMNAEVSNGTFDLYLCNESGDHAFQALDALERLEASGVADILRRTLDAIPGGWCLDQDERCQRVSAVPDRWNVFRRLTDAYYAAIETREELEAAERAVERIAAAYLREGLLP